MALTKIKSGGVSSSIALDSPDINTPDIDGGTIDGTVIGGNTAAAISGTTGQFSGEITANGGIALADGGELTLGDSDEFKIKHHASGYTHLQNTVGTLYIDSDSVTFRDDDGSPSNMVISQTGIDVTGTATMDGLTVNSGGSNVATSFISTDVTVGIKLQDPTGNVELSASGSTFNIQPSGGTSVFSAISSGYIHMAGASDVRLTLGSQGTAGNNDANWIRGNGTSLSYNAASANHIWETGGSEKMRLDGANLLVSTTSDFASGTVDGILAQGTNKPAAAFSNTAVGQIVKFYEGGSLAGSIGTPYAGELYIGGSGANSSGLLFTSGNTIQPRKNDAADNGNIDLGASGNRFKDAYLSGGVRNVNGDGFNAGTEGGEPILIPADTSGALNGQGSLGHPSYRWKDAYLSGGVYLGGTGAANKLDDYEEGTWTPNTGGGGVTWLAQQGVYTKVGRLVTVTFWLQAGSTDSTSGGVLIVGLPYATNSVGRNTAAIRGYNLANFSGNDGLIGWTSGNATSVTINATQAGLTSGTAVNKNVWRHGAELHFSLTYMTT
jgi:hypothetical protein